MSRIFLGLRPLKQSIASRSYSQGGFDISKILAATSGATDPAKSRDNRFFNKYSDKPNSIKQNTSKSFGKKTPGDFQRHRGKYDDSQNFRGSRRTNNQWDRYSFDIRTGSDRAQEALKDIIVKVKGFSPTFQVRYVDSTTNKIHTRHLSKIVNQLDLTKEGLLLVPPKAENEIPLVRINKLAEMLQNYSDQLAAQKEEELMQSGSERFMKKMLIRQQAEKKKSATKVLTLSWSISLSDLANQKKTEILNRLKKDEKFQICVDDRKGNFDPTEDPEEGVVSSKLNRLNDEDYDFEMNKRQLLFDKLQQILEDCNCRTTVTGSLEGKIIVNVTARQPVVSKVEQSTQQKEKEMKRLKKAQRARELADKKASTSEDDLDALYSFKIED